MSIENQIAVNADEPEQNSVEFLYCTLLEDGVIYTGNNAENTYELSDITDLIDAEDLKEAAQESITDNPVALHVLYIKTIQSLME